MKKKLLSLVLALAMVVGICPAALAEGAVNTAESMNNNIAPMSLEEVQSYIWAAAETLTVPVQGGEYTYYFGENHIVVQENESVYYLITHNDDFTSVAVNGKSIETISVAMADPHVTLPTAWCTVVDINKSFDVGGLPASVIGGLVASVITGNSKIAGAIVGAVVGCIIGGIFPSDCYLTVIMNSKVRVIEIDPTIGEYVDFYGAYLGPNSNHYETVCYEHTETYERPIDGYDF